MAIFGDRIKVACSTTGSTATTLTLGSAVSGFQTLSEGGLSNGDSVRYVIEDGSNFEIGLATYATGSPDTLTGRSDANVSASSSSNNRISLSGSSTLFIAPTAADLQTVHVYSATSDLPSASDNHGMIAHVHGEGAMYFAHGGSWVKLANYSDITTYSNATTSAAGLMSAADKTKLDGIEASADVTDTTNVVAALTAGTNITIAADGTISSTASGGGGSTASALTEQEFTATAGQTVFTVTGGITNADNVVVFLNGSRLFSTDVTVSDTANTVTLAAGATVGDLVTVSEFGAASGSGVTTYTGKSGTDGTPAGATYIDNVSSPSEGDLAYDLAADQLYIRTTSAWTRLALGVDESPIITTEPPTTHTLNSDGSTSTVTMVATDPEGFGITYGIAYPTANNALPDQLATATSINQSTGVFTFDPSTTNAGTVKVRLSASDGARTTTRLVTLSLTLIQGWMIGSGAYDNKSFSVSSQEANPRGIDISADGTIMIMTGNTADDIFYYTLSTAFDVSSASYTGFINQTDTVPNDLRFGDSGTKVFVSGNGNSNRVQSIPLSTAYDLSTAGTVTQSSSLATLSSNANTSYQGMAWKTDGTKMYILDWGSNSVHEYSLSTAWDVSTLNYTTDFSISSQETSGQAVDFSGDGTKMFVVGQGNDTVYQYNLSTAWDVSTASYSNTSFSIGSQEGMVGGMCFGDSGKTMYIVGQTNDTIYQYSTEA